LGFSARPLDPVIVLSTVLFLTGCAGSATGPSGIDTKPGLNAIGNRRESHTTSCAERPCIYASNPFDETVYLFPDKSKPQERAKVLFGPSTGLFTPWGIAVDAEGEIYVSDQQSNEILVFARDVVGDVRPIRTIVGAKTLLHYPSGMAIDEKGLLYVANQEYSSVEIFAHDANGNVAALRRITGIATMLNNPIDVALGPADEIYVENADGSSGETINVYGPQSEGNVAPLRTIGGSNSNIGRSMSIAVDESGEVYAAHTPNGDLGAIVVFAANASGNVAPVRTISGSLTQLSPLGLTLAHGTLYVTNSNDITEYPQTANGNVAPTLTVTTDPALGPAQHLVVH
jgi:hypothetical protein